MVDEWMTITDVNKVGPSQVTDLLVPEGQTHENLCLVFSPPLIECVLNACLVLYWQYGATLRAACVTPRIKIYRHILVEPYCLFSNYTSLPQARLRAIPKYYYKRWNMKYSVNGLDALIAALSKIKGKVMIP